MPTKAAKNWGQANRDLLNDLINRQLIDITDTTLQNINQVKGAHFQHRDKRNFCLYFCNFLAAWDLEVDYSGARRIKGRQKMRHLLLLIL
jgi:hypothetical protein